MLIGWATYRMPHYDTIASDYNAYRSDYIGVATVSNYLNTIGWDVAVLDMGCGTGKPIAAVIAGRVREYTGIEVSPNMARRFMHDVPMAKCLVADLATVNLGTSEFGLCFSWGSLCHLSPDSQRSALAIAARHTRVGGMIIFTGGVDEGSCSGSVGPLSVQHYSLGVSAYDDFLASHGCKPQFKGEVENGAAYLFAYTRIAQQGGPANAFGAADL